MKDITISASDILYQMDENDILEYFNGGKGLIHYMTDAIVLEYVKDVINTKDVFDAIRDDLSSDDIAELAADNGYVLGE